MKIFNIFKIWPQIKKKTQSKSLQDHIWMYDPNKSA